MNIARVGKTSLTVRFCKGQFDENQQSTLDASCLENTVNLPNGETMKLTIWDTAGQERYHALNPVYYRGAEGMLQATMQNTTMIYVSRCIDCLRYHRSRFIH